MNDEFIQVAEDRDFLLIDGCILSRAYIPENDAVKCHSCHSTAIYQETFDAYFCAYCNLWLEKKCGDKNCDYCPNRPDKPLPNENERRRLRNAKDKIVYPPE